MISAKLDKLEKVDVKILKMQESSGNDQYFVILVRNDEAPNVFSVEKQYTVACFQTIKNNLTTEECLERAWFEAGMVARFVGLKSMNEVLIHGLTEEEKAIMKKGRTLFRE